MTSDAKSLLWLCTVALLLGAAALAAVHFGPASHGGRGPFMFWVLLSLGLAITSGGFAVPLAREHRLAWLLVGLSVVLGCLAIASMRIQIP